MAPIARRADREEAVAAPTDLLEKRRVHGVGAAAVRSDWTYRPNRGTTDKAASARRSPRRSRGPGGSVRALTLSLRSLRDQPFPRPVPRPWTVPRLWTHSTRPQVAWKTAQNAVSHTAHRLLVFTVEKTDERSQARTARRPPSRFTRFQMSADTSRLKRLFMNMLNRLMAERVGFVPAIHSPINDLGLIGSVQTAKSTQSRSIRYKTGTAQSHLLPPERGPTLEPYDPRREHSIGCAQPRLRVQGEGGTSGSSESTSFGRSTVTTCQTMSSFTPRSSCAKTRPRADLRTTGLSTPSEKAFASGISPLSFVKTSYFSGPRGFQAGRRLSFATTSNSP